MRNILYAILKEQWFIEEGYVKSQWPLIVSLLNGKDISFANRDFVEPYFESTGSAKGKKADTVAIIPITGAITKYDGNCGEPGGETIARWIKNADQNPNVSAIVLSVDTPGGSGTGAMLLASAVRNASKPIVAHIAHGMAASAGYWIISQCDGIYCENKQDEVGSVGAFVMLADDQGEYEAKGWKFLTVYAPQSTDKNAPVRKAFEGDTTLIESRLEDLVNSFIADVEAGRGDKLKSDDWKTGKLFKAADAKKIGLIDGIATLEQTITEAIKLSKKTNNTMEQKKYNAIAAAAGWTEYETAEDGLHLQHEEAEKVEAQLQQASILATENETLKGEATTKDSQIDALTQQLATANNEIATLKQAPANDVVLTTDKDKQAGEATATEMDSVTREASEIYKRFHKQ